MPLLSFWKSNREEVLKLNVEQVVSSAGDGVLRDSTPSSDEFRGFLKEVRSDRLFDYSRHCLENSFPRSGLVLQDLVNELGRRLGFEVENGLYQGKRNAVGFDGIWRSPEGDLIAEVKTTDYVTVSLDKLARYKEKLVESENVSKNTSTLIIAGREDTGALEAQVRGSRFAWEMRLISIEQDRTDPALLNAKRLDTIESFRKTKGHVLVKNSRTLFCSADKSLRVCCAVSKRYDGDYQPYWYAFHPKWDEFLNGGSESFLLLSCMDRNEAYAVPYAWLVENKQNLNMTDRGERSYWHIALTTLPEGDLALNVFQERTQGAAAPLCLSRTVLNC